MYIGLLAYSQVFCGALGALIWGATVPESAWTVIPQITFGLMVIPLSCMELDEQVAIQSIMAHVRFVAIFVMVLGSMVALSIDGSKSNSTHPPYWALDEPDGCQMSYTACYSGFGVAFSTSLFSQLFQHSIPGLLRPLKEQPQKLSKVPVSKSDRGAWLIASTGSLMVPRTFRFTANPSSSTVNNIELLFAPRYDGCVLFWGGDSIVDQFKLCALSIWPRSRAHVITTHIILTVCIWYRCYISSS